MTVYKNKKNHSTKWLIALVIFVLGMTITWSEAAGAELSPVLKIHKASTAQFSYGGSRFRPNWYPGFLKPKKTILASATPLLNDSDNKISSVSPVTLLPLEIPATLRMFHIGQS